MSSISLSAETSPYVPYTDPSQTSQSFPGAGVDVESGLVQGLARRWRRELRRRKVGRAYDMALEVARVLPRHSRVLDVGCGNGYIAHHLSALIGANVLGIDLNANTEAPIHYRQFDGLSFPAKDKSFDAALLCYVLHHSQDQHAVLRELRRVLRDNGLAVVYEDIPASWWDRIVCGIHNRKWRKRTGPCTFRRELEWRSVFNSAGLEVVRERQLSRWRKSVHPVSRRLYVLRAAPAQAICNANC
jgi:SAM-dependent methyltransferase